MPCNVFQGIIVLQVIVFIKFITKMNTCDTIAAISTPVGTGGIGIVRISGPDCNNIVGKIFSNKHFLDRPTATFIHGDISDSYHNKIDRVLVVRFQSPHSYTGEDLVEIHCHGGLYVVQAILDTVCQLGARLSEPGEFTKRAFLNGKLDLVQAEAVADIIHSQTRKSQQLSFQHYQGTLSVKLQQLKETLKKQCGYIELELDFSDDVEFTNRNDLYQNIRSSLAEIKKLINSFEYGRIIKEGIHLTIVGEPNVGKSSILNRLLEYDRAIVTDIPGTTRDPLEESLDINGVLFKIADTAGLCFTNDPIEKIGIDRAKKLLSRADIILYVFQFQNNSIAPYNQNQFNTVIDHMGPGQKLFIVKNKIDLLNPKKQHHFTIDDRFPEMDISAKSGEGFERLEQNLYECAVRHKPQNDAAIITRLRHKNALQSAFEFLQHAERSLQNKLSAEFIALDLNNALASLGEITGEVTRQEILDDIFSSFCIGK